MAPLTPQQIRAFLAPEEPADDLLIQALSALRSAGHDLDVLEADGVGPTTAYAVVQIGGRRMRLSAEPW